MGKRSWHKDPDLHDALIKAVGMVSFLVFSWAVFR